MPSKKPKRDESGAVMVPGCETFGTVVRHKPSKCPRATRLKSEASTRILLLMKKGPDVDRFARKPNPVINKMEKEYLEFQNNLARQPAVVQFAYHRGKLKELRQELKELRESSNYRKLKLSEPVILREMEEVEKQLKELGEIILAEKKVISRSTDG